MTDDLDWRQFGACRGMDPDLFFPLTNHADYDEKVAEAKAICATCSVRQPCLDLAMDRHEREGIWGGLTKDQRKNLRYPRKRVKGKLQYVKEQR